MAKASLYETSIKIRRIVTLILIVIGVILLADTLFKSVQQAPDFFNPDESFYVEQASGDEVEIPQLPLTSLKIANDNPSFVTEGFFPKYPDSAFIYLIEKPKVKLDYEKNAIRTASALGFIGDGYTSLNGNRNTDLLWENTNKTRSLKFNAETLTWRMRTQYFFDPAALQPKILLETEDAYRSVATKTLNQLGFSGGAGLSSPFIISKFARLGNDALFTNPIVAANANYVSIDIFRYLPLARLKPKNQRPNLPPDQAEPPEFDGRVYKADPRTGSVHLVVGDSGANTGRDIYELDFVDFVYRDGYLIREIITPQEAWDQVRQGEGKLRLLKTQTSDYFQDSQVLGVERFVLAAERTEVGYYEPEKWDGFVYPIYIFRGRAELSNGQTADFVFYMEAVRRGVVRFE